MPEEIVDERQTAEHEVWSTHVRSHQGEIRTAPAGIGSFKSRMINLPHQSISFPPTAAEEQGCAQKRQRQATAGAVTGDDELARVDGPVLGLFRGSDKVKVRSETVRERAGEPTANSMASAAAFREGEEGGGGTDGY